MEKDKNIVLIGMPGAGKSTVGVLLAKAMGRYFLDTDVFIQAVQGRSLRELIETEGLAGFCEIERQYAGCVDIKNAVIATGGSVVYYESAMRHLKSGGVVVYLEIALEELERRLTDMAGRGVVIEPGQTLGSLYKKRRPLYEKYADVTINTAGQNHEQVVEAVLRALQ